MLWKVEVPWSPSSPCVWGERIFLTTFNQGELEVRAHDRRDGRLVWARGLKADKLEEFHSTDGSPAASTPATDGEHVVSYFGSFGVICHDASGQELWRHTLPLALSGGRYGTGTSPIILGGRVILNRDQDFNSSLLALSVTTGNLLWETPRTGVTGGFGTPILWHNGLVDEVVMPGSVRLKGYDLATGIERWMVEGAASFVCTTPVVGDNQLFFAAWSQGKADSGFPTDWPSFLGANDKNGDGKILRSEFDPVQWDYMRGLDVDRDGEISEADFAAIMATAAKASNSLIAVRSGGTGDISHSHVSWTSNRGLPYVPSPLYYDGRIYLIKDGGMISSIEAKSGKLFYTQERLNAGGAYYASPVAADGRIYLVSVSGKLTVVKAGGETPQILHQADFGERIFATPAMVGDRIYLRTQTQLLSLGEK